MRYALQPGVVCRDKNRFEQKLEALRQGGVASLHIVSDFDLTLTRGRVEGKHSNTALSQIRESGCLGEDFRRESLALRQRYHPVELDLSVPAEEKRRAMMEWSLGNQALLIKHGLSRGILRQVVRESPVVFRSGVDSLLEQSAKKSIPLLIFSAAIGDQIEDLLHLRERPIPTVHVIANFAEFDKQGMMVGVKPPVVSMFNKSEKLIIGSAYEKEVTSRRNVLLLGDSPGDLDMISTASHDTALTVGFLNDMLDRLDDYLNLFDIVIEHDTDLSFVLGLLQKVQ